MGFHREVFSGLCICWCFIHCQEPLAGAKEERKEITSDLRPTASKIHVSSSQKHLGLVGQAKPSPDTKAGLENTSLQLFGKGGNWTGNRQVLWKEQELPDGKQGKDTGHKEQRDNSLTDSAMVI